MPTGIGAFAPRQTFELVYTDDDNPVAEIPDPDYETAADNTILDANAVQAQETTTYAATGVTIDAGSITIGRGDTATYTIHSPYTTTTTIGDPYVYSGTGAYDRWTVTSDPNVTYSYPLFSDRNYVTLRDLENFFKRIYKVISDHTTINVSEEEFLKLIQEEDKDV